MVTPPGPYGLGMRSPRTTPLPAVHERTFAIVDTCLMTSEKVAPRSASEGLVPAGRLSALDGLRGLAAIIVVFSHLALTLAPISDRWIVPTANHPETGSFYWWITSTPLQLGIAGPQAVLIFFVLSGMVVALPVLKRRNFDWFAYYPQRVARLWVPVAASVLLALVLILITDQSAEHASSLWVAASSIGTPSWQQTLSTMNLLFGDITMNNPLWTIRWELVFSLMLPLFVAVAIATRRWWWVVLIATLPIVAVGTFAANTALIFLPVFLVGTVLAVKFEDIQKWSRTRLTRRGSLLLGIPALIVSLLLLDIHWTIWGLLGGAPRFQTIAHSLEYVGAFGLVVLAAFWMPAIRLLSTRLFQWLGRISFSLYLVHVPVILALDSVFDRQFTAVRVVASLAAALLVAVVFARLVERPAHRFSRWLGKSSSAGLSKWFTDAPAPVDR
jgi:peptidoglycan/LPS O-acetylase OafA/YrhL